MDEIPFWMFALIRLGQLCVVLALYAAVVRFFLVVRPGRRRRKIRERMLASRPELPTQGTLHAVNYASKVSTYRFLAPKSPSWDAIGLLVVRDDDVICICVSLDTHEEFELQFSAQKSTIEWIGPESLRLPLPRYSYHWLRIGCEGESHYFTDDRALKGWRSRDNTWALHEELRRVLRT